MERITGYQIESERSDMLTYHHARPIEGVANGVIRPLSPLRYDEDQEIAFYFDLAYKWLEKRVGFYPLFLAVGRTDEDKRMTGYQNQWLKNSNKNMVMFSYVQMPKDGVFLDFGHWHTVLNTLGNGMTERDLQLLFKPSFNKHDWITRANKEPHSVQLVVPELDLSKADMISVRNKKTQKRLKRAGFNNVVVTRLTQPNY